MALVERIAEAAVTWKAKLSSWQLATLMRAFATFRHHQAEGITLAMRALSEENASRLKELSTKREDIYWAGQCQRWHEIYMERLEANEPKPAEAHHPARRLISNFFKFDV